jgi:hypothetical protein
MATLDDLVEEVLSHQFSATQYTTYAQQKLNEGQAYICAQTDFRELESTTDLTLVSGTASYALPTDYSRLRTINRIETDSTAEALRSMEKPAFDLLVPSDGEPTRFLIQGSTVKVWPTPDASGTVRLNYFATPITLISGEVAPNTPQIPAQYTYIMVHWALKHCYERENDYNSAVYHKGEFEAGIMKCRGEVQYDTNDRSQPRVVGDGGPAIVIDPQVF